MEKNNKKIFLKNNQGITLVALITTVVIMILLAGIAISTGMESFNTTKLEEFYSQLEIAQKRVDDIASTNEKYVEKDGNIVYLNTAGNELTDTQKASVKEVLLEKGISEDIINNNINDFRYFTVQELNEILDLTDIEYNLFINFKNRIIVAENGLTIGDVKYYTLAKTMYFVEQNTDKNKGVIESLNYTVSNYNNNMYRLGITPSNTIGDLDGTGYIKYKEATENYWKTTTDLEIIVELNKEYYIQYIDLNNNKKEEKIKVEIVKDEDNNDKITVTKITEENNE